MLQPTSAVPDAAGNLYILDNGHASIRKVTANGTINTLVSKLPTSFDLKLGTARASIVTCDFSYDYVKINADYTT